MSLETDKRRTRPDEVYDWRRTRKSGVDWCYISQLVFAFVICLFVAFVIYQAWVLNQHLASRRRG